MKTYTHKPLAVARERLGYTLDDVMRRLYSDHKVEVSSKTVLNWENGATHPDADVLPALAKVLKLRMDDLYETLPE